MATPDPFSRVPRFLSDSFLASGNIASRSRQQGLQYVTEGYSHNVNSYERGKTMQIEGDIALALPAAYMYPFPLLGISR